MSQQETDMEELLALASFRRFLWRSIQSAGLFSQTSGRTDGRDLAHAEGRRSLMLMILRDVEAGQPAALQHPDSIVTLLAVLREEANPIPKEKAKRNDRYDEIEG